MRYSQLQPQAIPQRPKTALQSIGTTLKTGTFNTESDPTYQQRSSETETASNQIRAEDISGVMFEDDQSQLTKNVKAVNQIIEGKRHPAEKDLASMPDLVTLSRPGWGLRNRRIDIFEAESSKVPR